MMARENVSGRVLAPVAPPCFFPPSQLFAENNGLCRRSDAEPYFVALDGDDSERHRETRYDNLFATFPIENEHQFPS